MHAKHPVIIGTRVDEVGIEQRKPLLVESGDAQFELLARAAVRQRRAGIYFPDVAKRMGQAERPAGGPFGGILNLAECGNVNRHAGGGELESRRLTVEDVGQELPVLGVEVADRPAKVEPCARRVASEPSVSFPLDAADTRLCGIGGRPGEGRDAVDDDSDRCRDLYILVIELKMASAV